ncbi:MAG: hypothetical protein BWX80_03008 [Candidatus Hydrogenedentes bacterium ADurb.Bin101]|nr:MAG: hypothetical protein BWX80_03008 [Candidatus Hydrogenedentes bacterium ADurb.Bin101]
MSRVKVVPFNKKFIRTIGKRFEQEPALAVRNGTGGPILRIRRVECRHGRIGDGHPRFAVHDAARNARHGQTRRTPCHGRQQIPQIIRRETDGVQGSRFIIQGVKITRPGAAEIVLHQRPQGGPFGGTGVRRTQQMAVPAPVNGILLVFDVHVVEFNAGARATPGLDKDGKAAMIARRQHMHGRFMIQAQELDAPGLPGVIGTQPHEGVLAGYREQGRQQVGVTRVGIMEPDRIPPVGTHGRRNLDGGFKPRPDAGSGDKDRIRQEQRAIVRPDQGQGCRLRGNPGGVERYLKGISVHRNGRELKQYGAVPAA